MNADRNRETAEAPDFGGTVISSEDTPSVNHANGGIGGQEERAPTNGRAPINISKKVPEPERLGKVQEKEDRGNSQYNQCADGSDFANGLPLLFSQQSGHHRCGVETHMQTGNVEVNGNVVP